MRSGLSHMISRPFYLNQLIAFGNEKNRKLLVLSGVRGSGKTILFSLYRQYLESRGIPEEAIISYDLENTTDPTGAQTGTRRIYRGGGWNDFGKNLRSAYRAAGEKNMASFNLGIRLVRSAGKTLSGTVSTSNEVEKKQSSGKMLIVYFSWSGNTRGIAEEIRRQTGADLFEIVPIPAYSDDYNTVLMEAQRDQHDQARPEISDPPESIDGYDVILLGYPNWWASIPMPIATFLESYDFSGKTILPFCSHGGGRFGQSLTAIAKLAPQSVIAPGLSVHYSGGSRLPEEIRNWLIQNNVPIRE